MKKLYDAAKTGIKTPDIEHAEKLITETSLLFEKAVDAGMELNAGYEPSPDYINRLKKDVWLFSGCKSYIEMKEASGLLFDAGGKLKPFNRFRDDVLDLHRTYNIQYLKTEYENAVGASLMASRWAQFAENADRYYLQYRTARDERVRASHDKLHGITLPADDTFWDSFFPPNGWRCRCNVVQVLKSRYEKSDSTEAVQKGNEMMTVRRNDGTINQKATENNQIFRYNPGKQGVVFPQKHPYYTENNNHTESIKQKSNEIYENHLAEIASKPILIKKYENTGKLFIYPTVNKKSNDYNIVNKISDLFAAKGNEVFILPKVHFKNKLYDLLFKDAYQNKCPDIKVNDSFYEIESFIKPFKKNKIRNMISHGLNQADRIVIDIRDAKVSDNFILKGIHERIRAGKKISEVWIFNDNGLRQIF